MPASSSVEEMLARVEAIAAQFGQRATELSKFLELLQNRLRQLPGKQGVRVTERDVTLSFDRGGSGEWALLVECKECSGELVHTPVMVKAKAFQVLPQLMAAIEKQQQIQLEELKSAVVCDRSDVAGQSMRKKEGH